MVVLLCLVMLHCVVFPAGRTLALAASRSARGRSAEPGVERPDPLGIGACGRPLAPLQSNMGMYVCMYVFMYVRTHACINSCTHVCVFPARCRGPALEAIRLRVLRKAAQDQPLGIMHIDVTRAYFHATASRDICVKLPIEDQQEGEELLCGNFKKAMCGRREAAENWQNNVRRRRARSGSTSARFHNATSTTRVEARAGRCTETRSCSKARTSSSRRLPAHGGEAQHQGSSRGTK